MTNLVRWEPFRELISLREAMDRLFEESFVRPWAGWLAPVGVETLAVDMYETDDAIVIKSAIPGVKPEDLDVSVSGDTLTIKGEIPEPPENVDYILRERRYGPFSRTLTFNIPVQADKADVGPSARDAEPYIAQLFIGAAEGLEGDDFDGDGIRYIYDRYLGRNDKEVDFKAKLGGRLRGMSSELSTVDHRNIHPPTGGHLRGVQVFNDQINRFLKAGQGGLEGIDDQEER